MAKSSADDRRGMSCAFVPHPRVQVDFDNALSLTRQEFRDECDINVLMDRFEKTGILPVNQVASPGMYFDTDLLPGDFREAMDIVNESGKLFMQLPAKVRREFDNDPAKFVDYAVDPKNIDQLKEWGLTAPEKAPDAPMRVEVVPPPAPPAAPVEPPKAS